MRTLRRLFREPIVVCREKPEIVLVPLCFVAVVGVWEFVVRWWLKVPIYVVPAPSDIARALERGTRGGLYLINAWHTLSEALAGFAIAAVVGIVLGAIIAQFRLVERTVYPYLVALQTTPKIAIAPLFVLWFGFGMTSKVIVAALVSFFPILVNVIIGLRMIDVQKVDLLRSLRATRWQIFWIVRLPNALPLIFAGLNIAVVFSLLGAIVGEFVGSQKGLGNLIVQMNFNLDTAGVFGALVCLSAIGLGLHFVMQWIQRKLVFWAEPERITGA